MHDIVFFDVDRRFQSIARSIGGTMFVLLLVVCLSYTPQYGIVLFSSMAACYWIGRLMSAHQLSSISMKDGRFTLRNIRNNIVGRTPILRIIESGPHESFGTYVVFSQDIGIFKFYATRFEREQFEGILDTMPESEFQRVSSPYRLGMAIIGFWYFCTPLIILVATQVRSQATAWIPLCMAVIFAIATTVWAFKNRKEAFVLTKTFLL